MVTKFLKEMIALFIRILGIEFVIRNTIAKSKTTVLMYHNPPSQIFENHMRYLHRYYTIISLDTLVDSIIKKNWSLIPPKSLVVTIDDGYKENYELLKMIMELNIKPTIYLNSHLVNTNRSFWFKSGYKDYLKLKHVPHNERLEVLEKSVGFGLTKEYLERQTLNLDQMKEMSKYSNFASHTKFHPILTQLDDKECCAEISDSKETLEKMLEQEIVHFSYPNGDYGARELDLVKEAGYKSARTCDVGWNDINTNPYKLKVMGILDDASINVFAAQVCGVFSYLRYALLGSFNGTKPKNI